MTLATSLGLAIPLIPAPMAGVSTPEMAAKASNVGALGSIAIGASDAAGAHAMISEAKAQTKRPFNVNVFAHAPARRDAAVEAAWISTLTPLFAQYGATPPSSLREIYPRFIEDDAMLAVLLDLSPAVVSLHFGLPDDSRIRALKGTGCLLVATATNLAEATAARKAGIDAIVAQGYEAGGHRGAFDPDAPDDALSTSALTRLLVAQSGLPIIAAGGIMDGAFSPPEPWGGGRAVGDSLHQLPGK